MKVYTIEKVNVSKLYIFTLFGVLAYALLMILIISVIVLVFPQFDNLSLFFMLTSLIFGNYVFKFSFSKSSNKIQVKLNDKKMIIEEREILLDNVKSIKFKGTRYNYYPRIIIELADAEKINFRVSKSNDFEKLVLRLKNNSKKDSV